MQKNERNSPIALMEKMLREGDIDTKKLHEGATELTRQRIVDASALCFADKGYQKTSIDEIAGEAGVTKGAVYHHFKDKKELLMVANRSRQLQTQEVLRVAIQGADDFFTALKDSLGGEFRRLRNDPTSRGMMREYLAMAMTDPDINTMFRSEDGELIKILNSGLSRRYPNLSPARTNVIVQEIYISLAGVLMAFVIDSEIGTPAEDMLDSLLDRFRDTIQ